MAKLAIAFGLTLLVGACSVERENVEQRRPPPVVVKTTPSDAQIMADSQAACAAYGIPSGTAQFDRCVQHEFAARRPG